MAVLTFPGADAVLAAQAAALPQPDQLCGPFSARAALHAVLSPTEVPTLVELAVASGSAVWPHDMAAWRPAGAACDRSTCGSLVSAPAIESSGTDAAGLARGIEAVTGDSVAVVPVAGAGATATAIAALLQTIAGSDVPVGVVANLRTGTLDPDAGWDVGHFVVLWAIDVDHRDGARVAVADTYRELGAPGEPPGCRWVPLPLLAAAVSAAPGRGLLLLARAVHGRELGEAVIANDLDRRIWSV